MRYFKIVLISAFLALFTAQNVGAIDTHNLLRRWYCQSDDVPCSTDLVAWWNQDTFITDNTALKDKDGVAVIISVLPQRSG